MTGTTKIRGGAGMTWAFTMFSLTHEFIVGDRSPAQLLEDVVDANLANVIEIDAPQYFESYPHFSGEELDKFRACVERHGIQLSILGVYNDFGIRRGRPLDLDETETYIARQLEVAGLLGFAAARISFGVAPELLQRLAHHAEQYGVPLLQEAQGPLTPTGREFESQRAAIDRIGSQYLGFVFDLSMCMPRLPITYLEELRRVGMPEVAVRYLDEAWLTEDMGTIRERLSQLTSGAALTPDAPARLFLMFGRFGRTQVADWRDALGEFDAVHLKYWDLEDDDGRVSTPLADFRREFDSIGYHGVVTSEWGGHEWFVDGQPGGIDMARRHRAMFDAAANRSGR